MPQYIATRTLGRDGPQAKEGQTIELDEVTAAPLLVAGLLKTVAAAPVVKAVETPAAVQAPRKPKRRTQEKET